jgi:hypothetical protein
VKHILKFSVIFVALLISKRVMAYPDFIGYGYSSCITCHYSGSGGGALNDEQTTLEFAGLDFAIYNLQLDGLTSLADGDTPEQKNVLLTLNVAATDEASSVSRQSWNWEAAPASARSQTHSLDLSGKVSTLTLTASGYTGEYRSNPTQSSNAHGR